MGFGTVVLRYGRVVWNAVSSRYCWVPLRDGEVTLLTVSYGFSCVRSGNGKV